MNLDQFVNSLYPDIPLDLIQTVAHGVLNYFSSIEGSFWLFYNSDVGFIQYLDLCEYVIRDRGMFLDRNYVRIFMLDCYATWQERMEKPQLTAEEMRYAYAPVSHLCPPQVLWAILMWCASPHAEEWRSKNNPIYERAKYSGTVIEYQGEIFDADEVEILESAADACTACNVFCPYIGDHTLCRHCRQSTTEHICSFAEGCEIISCPHKIDAQELVASTGRRLLCRIS